MHFLGQSGEVLADPLVGVGQVLGTQVLGEIVGGGVHLGHIDVGALGAFAVGQTLLAGFTKLDLEFVVVLGPLGSFALAADGVHGPVIGDEIGHILIGITQSTGADAAETVAAEVAGVGHFLDDVVFHGEGVLLHGTDVLLIQSTGSLLLVLVQSDHGVVLGVLAVQQEAEVEGQQGQGLHLVGAGYGEVHVEVVVALQVLIHIEEAGALHHKGVDLLDGGVGVAALGLPLGRGGDDAVQGLGQQNQGTDNEAGVGVLVLDIVPDEHGQRQDDAGTGTAGCGGDHDDTHSLLHFLAVLAEQVVNGIVQGIDVAGLDGGVQGQTGNGTDLTGAFGDGLIVNNGILGEPVLQGVLIIVQVVTHGLGIGSLDVVDVGVAGGHGVQVVDVGIQTREVDVFLFLGTAHFGHLTDDAAAGTADADEQSRCFHLIGFQNFFCHDR